MSYAPIDLSAFPPEREIALRELLRYSLYKTVFYRSSVWQHTQRLLWLVEALGPAASKIIPLDIEKMRALALVHDDPEIITGDIPASNKVRLSAAKKSELDGQEMAAIDELSSRYPKTLNGYEYKQLLLHAQFKDCTEAQLVSFLDKLEGFCESLHEVMAGNFTVLSSVVFYARATTRFTYTMPALAPLFASGVHPLVQELYPDVQTEPVSFSTLTAFNKPHTKESLSVPSRFPFYDEWRKIVLERGGDEGLKWLTEVKESVQ